MRYLIVDRKITVSELLDFAQERGVLIDRQGFAQELSERFGMSRETELNYTTAVLNQSAMNRQTRSE